jgi:hypothetical protein
MKSVSYLVAVAAAICALFGAANSAQAWSHSNSGQWFNTWQGSYGLYTDEWGSSSHVTMYYNNTQNWSLQCNFGGGGIKAYPHTQVTTNTGNGSNIWAYFSASPGSGAFDEAFDNWDSGGSEYMIWENWGGSVGPIGGEVAGNVNIGGVSFNVYAGNVGHECVSFLRNGRTNSTTQGDIGGIMAWAVQHGYTHSNTVSNIQFGYEVTNTNGTQNWTLNGFSAGW